MKIKSFDIFVNKLIKKTPKNPKEIIDDIYFKGEVKPSCTHVDQKC